MEEVNPRVYVSARRALNDYDANKSTYRSKNSKKAKKDEIFVEPRKADICIATGSPMDVGNDK